MCSMCLSYTDVWLVGFSQMCLWLTQQQYRHYFLLLLSFLPQPGFEQKPRWKQQPTLMDLRLHRWKLCRCCGETSAEARQTEQVRSRWRSVAAVDVFIINEQREPESSGIAQTRSHISIPASAKQTVHDKRSEQFLFSVIPEFIALTSNVHTSVFGEGIFLDKRKKTTFILTELRLR